jgi:hypothetical protein
MMRVWKTAGLAVAVGLLGAVAPAAAVNVVASGGAGTCTIGNPNATPPVLAVPADVGLSAYDDDPPETNDELQIVDTEWSWGIVNVTYDPPNSCGTGTGNGSWSVVQPDPASPAASLVGTTPDAGTYQMTLECCVTYTMSDGSQQSGSSTADVVVTAS